MPCHDSRDDHDARTLAETETRLDLAARVACELWRALIAHRRGNPVPLSAETQTWVRDHEAWDRRRRARE